MPGQDLGPMLSAEKGPARGWRRAQMGRSNTGNHLPKGNPKIRGSGRVNEARWRRCSQTLAGGRNWGQHLTAMEHPLRSGVPSPQAAPAVFERHLPETRGKRRGTSTQLRVQGGARVGFQWRVCKTQQLILCYYFFIIVLFPMRTAGNLLSPTPAHTTRGTMPVPTVKSVPGPRG